MGSVPAGTTLHARIYTKTDGNFSLYQDVSFSAAAGMATFTKPTNGATNVDTTVPF